MSELDRAIKSEKDPKACEQLRAVRAIREFGYSVAEMALYNDVSTKTIRNWLARYDEAGSGGMKNQPTSGRPPAITMKQIQKTAARLLKDGELTTASFQEELRRERGGGPVPLILHRETAAQDRLYVEASGHGARAGCQRRGMRPVVQQDDEGN